MRGDFLALGAMGALAAASSVRGARAVHLSGPKMLDRPLEVTEFPWYTVGTASGYQGTRYAWPAISADTAKDWMEEMESQGYKRIDYVTKPGRSVHISKYATSWLMRDGTLASDVKLRRTLGGAYLEAGDFMVPLRYLPENLRRRVNTIEVLRRHGTWNTYDAKHRIAMHEMVSQIAAMDAEDPGFQDSMRELAWASENPRSGRGH